MCVKIWLVLKKQVNSVCSVFYGPDLEGALDWFGKPSLGRPLAFYCGSVTLHSSLLIILPSTLLGYFLSPSLIPIQTTYFISQVGRNLISKRSAKLISVSNKKLTHLLEWWFRVLSIIIHRLIPLAEEIVEVKNNNWRKTTCWHNIWVLKRSHYKIRGPSRKTGNRLLSHCMARSHLLWNFISSCIKWK